MQQSTHPMCEQCRCKGTMACPNPAQCYLAIAVSSLQIGSVCEIKAKHPKAYGLEKTAEAMGWGVAG